MLLHVCHSRGARTQVPLGKQPGGGLGGCNSLALNKDAKEIIRLIQCSPKPMA